MQSMFLVSRRLGWTIAMLLGVLGGARGDYITPAQIRTVPLTDTNWDTRTTAGIPKVTFDKFSSPFPGDALQRVIIAIDYNVESPYSVTFKQPATFRFQTLASLSVLRPNGTALAPLQVLFNDHQIIPGAAGQRVSRNRSTSGSLPSIILQSPSDLALFSGPGQITLPVVARAFTNIIETSGNVDSLVETRVGVRLSLRFEVVPEPSGFVLIGVGGGGLLLVGTWLRHPGRPRLAAS